MWMTRNRARYERKGLRYQSDLTDEEYGLIERFLPPERSISRRSLVNGILYVLTTGCQWRQLPKDFPPKSTTHDYFVELQCTGVLTQIHHALYGPLQSVPVGNETIPGWQSGFRPVCQSILVARPSLGTVRWGGAVASRSS